MNVSVKGDKEMRYKCERCFLILEEVDLVDGLCPTCGLIVKEMCPKDRSDCICGKDIHETIAYCEVCGEAICPGCGCHDVTQISRVTGYLQEVKGFNVAKQQELRDRVRVDSLGNPIGNIGGKYA